MLRDAERLGGGLNIFYMASSLNQGPFAGPHIVRHSYKKDPTRDPNRENYLCP